MAAMLHFSSTIDFLRFQGVQVSEVHDSQYAGWDIGSAIHTVLQREFVDLVKTLPFVGVSIDTSGADGLWCMTGQYLAQAMHDSVSAWQSLCTTD